MSKEGPLENDILLKEIQGKEMEAAVLDLQ